MQLEIIMTKGLPASGKSTWAKGMCAVWPEKYVRISKDDIRKELGGPHSKAKEKRVIELRDSRVLAALYCGYCPIVDDTNFNPVHYNRMKEIAKKTDSVVIWFQKFLEVPLEECIRRDSWRPNPVGEKVILNMYNKYLAPKQKVEPYREYPGKPYVVIVDIDGTIALHDGRSPYDTAKAADDKVNYPVTNMLRSVFLVDDSITPIYVSGRDEEFRELTRNWIRNKTMLPVGPLFMRPNGDRRKDSIVKKEIFDTHIRGHYNVEFVVDDRQQVVDMWRNECGLTCFQVAEGNF